jgi:hypothetical protein
MMCHRLLDRMDSLIGKGLILKHCVVMQISTSCKLVDVESRDLQKANSSRVLPKVSGKKK